jgi:integrase
MKRPSAGSVSDCSSRAWPTPQMAPKIHVPDIDYFSLSMKDGATAKALRLRDFPSLDQVRAGIAAMPVETVIDRRNRALVAFAILTGMRDRAIVSLSLRHVDLSRSPPLVSRQSGPKEQWRSRRS